MEDKFRVYCKATRDYFYSEKLGLVKFFALLETENLKNSFEKPDQYVTSKNGVDLYSGDILGSKIDPDLDPKAIYFDDEGFCYFVDDQVDLASWIYDECLNVEKIGTIHKNPGLLI